MHQMIELAEIAHKNVPMSLSAVLRDGMSSANAAILSGLGVELDGEAAHVAVRVGVALVGGHDRDAQEQWRALAHFVEEGGFGPLFDVGGHLEVAEGAAALDVVHAIGDALADEVGQLLVQVGVLQQHGAGGADRERVLIAGHRTTGIRGRVRWSLVADLVFLSLLSFWRIALQQRGGASRRRSTAILDCPAGRRRPAAKPVCCLAWVWVWVASPSCLKPLGYSSSSLWAIVRAISSASGGLR